MPALSLASSPDMRMSTPDLGDQQFFATGFRGTFSQRAQPIDIEMLRIRLDIGQRALAPYANQSPLAKRALEEIPRLKALCEELDQAQFINHEDAAAAVAQIRPRKEVNARFSRMISRVLSDTAYLSDLKHSGVAEFLASGLDDSVLKAKVNWQAGFLLTRKQEPSGFKGSFFAHLPFEERPVINVDGARPKPEQIWAAILSGRSLPRQLGTLHHEFIHCEQADHHLIRAIEAQRTRAGLVQLGAWASIGALGAANCGGGLIGTLLFGSFGGVIGFWRASRTKGNSESDSLQFHQALLEAQAHDAIHRPPFTFTHDARDGCFVTPGINRSCSGRVPAEQVRAALHEIQLLGALGLDTSETAALIRDSIVAQIQSGKATFWSEVDKLRQQHGLSGQRGLEANLIYAAITFECVLGLAESVKAAKIAKDNL